MYIFRNLMIDLDFFSRLPPYTFIELRSDGQFTYKTSYSCTSHVNDVLLSLELFRRHFIKILEDNNSTPSSVVSCADSTPSSVVSCADSTPSSVVSCADSRHNRSYKFRWLIRQFKRAYEPKNGGGLKGLSDTYPTISKEIQNLLLELKINMEIDEYSVEHFKCPEEEFTDIDWQMAMEISSQLTYEYPGYYKYYIQYEASLYWNQFMNTIGLWNWYDKIYDGPNMTELYLGALPLRSNLFYRNDLEALRNLGIGAVLTVTEVFENTTPGYLYKPVSGKDWRESGINFYQVPIQDFGPICLDQIDQSLAYIDWNLKNGRSVYIHCKAGVNRSNLICMAYLVKFAGMTSDQAFDHIKQIRKQIQTGIGGQSMITLKEFESRLQKS